MITFLCCISFYLISCEHLNFCFPAKTEHFYWLRSQCSKPELSWEVALFFSAEWQETREHSNVNNFLPDLHNNPSTFPGFKNLYENSNAILIRLYSQCTLVHNQMISSDVCGKLFVTAFTWINLIVYDEFCDNSYDIPRKYIFKHQFLNIYTFLISTGFCCKNLELLELKHLFKKATNLERN